MGHHVLKCLLAEEASELVLNVKKALAYFLLLPLLLVFAGRGRSGSIVTHWKDCLCLLLGNQISNPLENLFLGSLLLWSLALGGFWRNVVLNQLVQLLEVQPIRLVLVISG